MRIKSVHTRCLFGLLAVGVIAATTGCGYVAPEVEKSPSPRTDGSIQSCDQAPLPEDALTLVVLDWDGGQSPLVRDKVLTGFDVTSLELADGKSISQDEFESMVLARVGEILCVLDPMDVAVIIGDGADYQDSTVIHITGDEPANEAKHIGQSHFDLCNEHLDDSGVIWGGALASRVASASLDEWINAFANTIAHETGHTLGFFHPDPDVVERLLLSPSTEIMRAHTTTDDLLKPQAFLLDQDTCPGSDGIGDTSYRVTGGVAYVLE
ncbi:MAG: hypothetical protein DHS20C16_15950 [Phycisphaerae bacterium]|nr:MAG: hypothetical protein DHS20C16_15950 [Phycisphaerae bacterium]